MSKSLHLSGVYAALPTPFGEQGTPVANWLDPLLDALVASGVAGLCVGGATGEYAVCDVDDRLRLFRQVAAHIAQRVPLVLGIGAEHYQQVRRMAKVAADLGAIAVLLPPPAYFTFPAHDLAEMLRQVARTLPLPVLLYHIPQFTHDLGVGEIVELVRAEENIAGAKDSSGQRATLELLAAAKRETNFTLLVGSDNLFLTGLALGADGCISGLSCILPELMLGIYHVFQNGDHARARVLQQLVSELAMSVGELPTPWGIKIALETQGYILGNLSWPPSARLAARAEQFRRWFLAWAPAARNQLLAPAPSLHEGG